MYLYKKLDALCLPHLVGETYRFALVLCESEFASATYDLNLQRNVQEYLKIKPRIIKLTYIGHWYRVMTLLRPHFQGHQGSLLVKFESADKIPGKLSGLG